MKQCSYILIITLILLTSANATDSQTIKSCQHDTRTLSEMLSDKTGFMAKVPKDFLIETSLPKMVTVYPTHNYKLPYNNNGVIESGLGANYRFNPICEVTGRDGDRWLVEGDLKSLHYIPEEIDPEIHQWNMDTVKHYDDLTNLQRQYPASWVHTTPQPNAN